LNSFGELPAAACLGSEEFLRRDLPCELLFLEYAVSACKIGKVK
jgi:hypothetical protein